MVNQGIEDFTVTNAIGFVERTRMPEINGITLMMAIQAVDSKAHEIASRLEKDGDPEAGEREFLLLHYENALASLRAGYEEALKTLSNRPPHESLVGD